VPGVRFQHHQSTKEEAMKTAYADPIAQAAIDRLEAKVERLSSLVATYELDQQEDERIIAELRAKVAAVEKLAGEMDHWCSPYGIATHYADSIRRALEAKP
jgi:uncharacterized iron-regulated protein